MGKGIQVREGAFLENSCNPVFDMLMEFLARGLKQNRKSGIMCVVRETQYQTFRKRGIQVWVFFREHISNFVRHAVDCPR